MAIACNAINQVANELLMAFEDCNKIKNSDLRKLVELIVAVNDCSNGGPHYDNENTDVYEPLADEIVNYPINTFHSYSIAVLNGKMTQTTGMSTVTYNEGTIIEFEFTTLNNIAVTFTAKAGSTIVVKYITETV